MATPELLARLSDETRRAEDALARGAHDEALRAADALEALGHVTAWEVRARAHWGAGRPEDALAVLADGIRRVPTTARLWEVFGAFQREVGRLDEADASFRNALRCDDADRGAIALQVGLLRLRQGRFDDALEVLELVGALGAPGAARQAALLRARARLATGRPAEALATLDAALAEGGGDGLDVAYRVERARAREALGDLEGARADAAAAERLASRAADGGGGGAAGRATP